MKKIISTSIWAVVTLLSISLFSFKLSNKNLFAKKHVDATITSTSGCQIHIVGDVNYTIFPPNITGFTGTVTLSGTCSGSYTFARNVSAVIQSDGTKSVEHMTWTADTDQTISVLTDPNVDSQIRALIENSVNDQD